MMATFAPRYPSRELRQLIDNLDKDTTQCSSPHKNPSDCCKAGLHTLATEISQLTPPDLDARFSNIATRLHHIISSTVCGHGQRCFVPGLTTACQANPDVAKLLAYVVCQQSNSDLFSEIHECKQKILQSYSEISGSFQVASTMVLGSVDTVNYELAHTGDTFISVNCAFVLPQQAHPNTVNKLLSLDSYLVRYHYLLEKLYDAPPPSAWTRWLGPIPGAAVALVPLAVGASLPFALLAGGVGYGINYMVKHKVGIYASLPDNDKINFLPLAPNVPELEFGFDPHSSGYVNRSVGFVTSFVTKKVPPSGTCGYLRLRWTPETPLDQCPCLRVDLGKDQPIHPNNIWILRELIRARFVEGAISYDKIYHMCAALKRPIPGSSFPNKPLVELFAAASLESLIPPALALSINGNNDLKNKLRAACVQSAGRAQVPFSQIIS